MVKVFCIKKIDSLDGLMSNFLLMVLIRLILGIQEATKAGKVLQQNGFEFDICYTSVLTRAIQTFNYAADELDCHYIPVIKSWKLN
jgi:bisphosphoglycerate-dependent phosphoglycerate mutase